MISASWRNSFTHGVNKRFFYGWVMLGVGALGLFASGPGQSHIFSVFLTPMTEDLGLSHTSISSAYAFATLVAAFGLPWVGRRIDRFGARRVLVIVVILLSIAAALFGQVSNLIALGFGFAALRFLGQGSLMLSCNNLVAQWFQQKRGFAMSLAALGFSLSMAVHPPLAQWLTSVVGWRDAWLWLGIMTLLMLLPPVLLLVQNKPEDVGLRPDGIEPDRAAIQRGAPVDQSMIGLTLRQAIRTSTFWILAIAFFDLSMQVTAMFFYQVSIFESHDLGPALAAQMFSVSAVTMVASMPVLGKLMDRLPTPLMLAIGQIFVGLALVSLVFIDGLLSAIVYAVVFGVANACIHTSIGFVWPHYFGRRHLGSIQGTAQTIAIVGASLGPLPLGIAFDLHGSYNTALWMLTIVPVLCAGMLFFLRAPKLTDAN